MKNFNNAEYNLFVAEDNFQNYLVLEENIGYNHCIIDWDLSDTETSAIAQKFYTIGLTEDDFCDGENWEEWNFRDAYNSSHKVERPSLKVYVNDPGDITIVLHMSKNDNIWAYFDDEDAITFLVSYFNGGGDFDISPFKHLWGMIYYDDEEMKELVNGLTLVGENGVISDEVTPDWPVSGTLARAGFCYRTERKVTVHGRIPTQKDLDTIATYMDDDAREDLHGKIAPCAPEYFLRQYIWSYADADPDFIAIMKDEFGLKWKPMWE